MRRAKKMLVETRYLACRIVRTLSTYSKSNTWLVETQNKMASRDEILLSRRAIWLVETQNKILSRIAILYYTSSVQVERQMGMRIWLVESLERFLRTRRAIL